MTIKFLQENIGKTFSDISCTNIFLAQSPKAIEIKAKINKQKGTVPHPHTKISSKWLKDLNIRHDTIKLLEENISNTFYDINHSNVFLGQFPKEKEIKTKVNKWDLN